MSLLYWAHPRLSHCMVDETPIDARRNSPRAHAHNRPPQSSGSPFTARHSYPMRKPDLGNSQSVRYAVTQFS